uniref:Uncharacterized protein n=1 Tax=Globodera pallida TaxID=36090 RepID=A0A183CKW6_GLOPA
MNKCAQVIQRYLELKQQQQKQHLLKSDQQRRLWKVSEEEQQQHNNSCGSGRPSSLPLPISNNKMRTNHPCQQPFDFSAIYFDVQSGCA